MALLMVMTVCLRVYAALEYRIRQALQRQQETLPDQKGRRDTEPNSPVGVPCLRRDARLDGGRTGASGVQPACSASAGPSIVGHSL